MLRREDMLELTRRMTPARSSIDRIAGCYFDEDGYSDGSFNRSFLNLKASEKEKNLKLAKAIPFSETNVQLTELDFPGETRESGDMMRLLDAIMECGLKNDALLETFYEVLAEQQPKVRPFAVFLFHGIYDIPRKGTDKAEQWESEEVYEYMVCWSMVRNSSSVKGKSRAPCPACSLALCRITAKQRVKSKSSPTYGT
jgi:hypothetical protein